MHEGNRGRNLFKQGFAPVLRQNQGDHAYGPVIQSDRHTYKGLHLAVMILRALPTAFLIPLMLQQHILIGVKYLRNQRTDLNILIQREILERASDHVHIRIRDDDIGFQDIRDGSREIIEFCF